MNTRLMGILIRKDIRLVRMPIVFYTAVGALAVGMIGMQSHAMFYAGSVLLITAMIALGFHPTMATVVGERKEQTLAFIMSMPITPAEYTWTKILANLLMFFIPWAVLVTATVILFLASPNLPDGLIPFSMILYCYLAATAVAILCVALVSDSMQLTIALQVSCNLGFQGIMYAASNNAAIKATMHGESVVWSSAALLFIGVLLALCVAMLALTLYLQSRKTDFL